jgi:non-specific serine/threonine protein kinase
MLQVKLLGQFEVQRDGTPISIPSRLAQSLLAYLLLTAGTAHRREKLAGLLWPDTTDENARRNLRQELWRLRKAIESSVPGKGAATFLLVDEITIAFDPQSDYWLDVSALAKSDAAAASSQDLMDALSLYRGELLPGFYDEWVVLERERLRATFEQKMARLLDLLTEEKRWHAVLEWGERWIALGQSPEPAYRALMAAHSALGDRSKVAAIFERCAQALRNDLGVEPSSQTQRLFEQLSNNSFRTTDDSLPARPPAMQPRVTNLPVPLTSFIGRESEIAQIEPLVLTSRLLTLTGSGGSGKTRLALEVANRLVNEFADGVWQVELAPLSDPALVPQAVAQVLGVIEQPGRSLVERLADFLESRELLLILDNCEHLVAACAEFVEGLLRQCCLDLRILATSREPLNVAGEAAWRVPSLSLPPLQSPIPNFQSLSQYEAIRLFVERAKAAAPGFALTEHNAATVAQICYRLDGMPLAIELAAARVKVLSVEQIAARLDDRFNLLRTTTRMAPARHQTLQATIDWSYALLSNNERVLLRRLSVFAGGCALDAVEAVCADKHLTLHPPFLPEKGEQGIGRGDILDLLSRLVDKSLVVAQEQPGQVRYHLLETIRQYAREKLYEVGEANQVRERHLDFFQQLAEQAEPKLIGAEQLAWMDYWEIEHDNVRAALAWAQSGGSVEMGLHLASALWRFWQIRGYLREGRGYLENLLAKPESANDNRVLAKSLLVLGILAGFIGDAVAARVHLEQSKTLWLQLGPAGKAGLARARHFQIMQDLAAHSNPALVRRHSEDNLKLLQEVGDQWGIANTFAVIGLAARREGNLIEARRGLETSLALFQAIGEHFRASSLIKDLGGIAFREGNYAEARVKIEEALQFYRRARHKLDLDTALWMLGAIAIREKDYVRARTWYSECLAYDQEIGETWQLPECLIGFAGIAEAENQFERATRLLGAAEAQVKAREGTLEDIDRAESQRLACLLREQLEEATFNTAWAEGGAMETEQAIAYALAEPETEGPRPAHSLTLLRAAKKQFGGLTAREREAAALVAQGKSNREIARNLVVSERTVGAHISNILSKLEFTSRTQIVTWAIEKGLAKPRVN